MRSRPAVVLAVALLAGLSTGCTSGGGGKHVPPGVTGTRATADNLRMHVVGADVVGPNRVRAPLADEVRTDTLQLVQRTFDATVVDAAVKRRAGRLTSLFTADAATRAAGTDRGALFDEHLPAIGELLADKLDVRLTALAGDDDKPAVVVAKLDWDLHSPDGNVRIRRVGELTMVPVFARWFVAAYAVITGRTVGGRTTTTTATTSTTTTAGGP